MLYFTAAKEKAEVDCKHQVNAMKAERDQV